MRAQPSGVGLYLCPQGTPILASGRDLALRRLKKISGASRRGSLPFRNNCAVCSFSTKNSDGDSPIVSAF